MYLFYQTNYIFLFEDSQAFQVPMWQELQNSARPEKPHGFATQWLSAPDQGRSAQQKFIVNSSSGNGGRSDG